MANGTGHNVLGSLQIWLLRLLLFFPGVRRAFFALVERYLSTTGPVPATTTISESLQSLPPPALLLPPPLPTPSLPLPPSMTKPSQVSQNSDRADFVSVQSISSASISDLSVSSSSLYYDPSNAGSTHTSVSEQMRALYATSNVPHTRPQHPKSAHHKASSDV